MERSYVLGNCGVLRIPDDGKENYLRVTLEYKRGLHTFNVAVWPDDQDNWHSIAKMHVSEYRMMWPEARLKTWIAIRK